MKKHFLIWGILMGMVGSLVADRNVWAIIEDEDGEKWYDTAELLEMAAETGENKIISQFSVTGINVKENKIRILLQDEAAMDFMMPSEKTIFEEIGIMQYKCEMDEECSAKFWEIMDYVISGVPMENVTALYQAKNETDEQTMMVNEEFEVELAELEDDELGLAVGEFQAYMIGDNTNSVGGIVYRDCLESPEYEEGMWCKKMTSEMMNSKYVPVWENEDDGDEKKDKEDLEDMEFLEGAKDDDNIEEDIEKQEENETSEAEIAKYATVVEDGGWEDENWKNDDWDNNQGSNDWENDSRGDDGWEDFLGPENFDNLEELDMEPADNFDDELKYEDAKVKKIVGDSYQKYQWIWVIVVIVIASSFLFMIFFKKSRKKSEKTLDNLENMI